MPTVLSIPCDQSISGCDCTLDPSTNYSSEEPDSQVFFGSFSAPPIVGTFFAPACLGFCESTESQQAADDCAEAAAVDCSLGGAPTAGNPLWSSSRHRFGNTLQECTKECGDGNSITVDVPAGSVISYTQADADARAMGRACKRAGELLVCFVTTSPLTAACVGDFVSVPIVASGGEGDYLFTLESGTLPTGVTLDDVGLLSGTPTTAGTYTFEIRVDDSGGGTATRTYVWGIVQITTATALPAGSVNVAYSQAIAQTGGTAPLTWSVTSGSLPTGITLNSITGVLSGTPTVAGSYSFSIGVLSS